MSRKIVTDYYRVELDEEIEETPEQREFLAILNAKDRARITAIPCSWTRVKDSNGVVTVARKRYRKLED